LVREHRRGERRVGVERGGGAIAGTGGRM